MRKSLVLLAASFQVACVSGNDAESESATAPLNAQMAQENELAQCGRRLGAVDAETLETPYEDALATWPSGDNCATLRAYRGLCSDGKRFLYDAGGYTLEVRYFDGSDLVGAVLGGDVGNCPSACPFSRYYGNIKDVTCEIAELEPLCPAGPTLYEDIELRVSFANGLAPGGCE